ncbi:hypothetical protein PWP89_04420 [Stenotrophomonas rhizophila]|uniref:ATP synthase protein I n=1 Tax=Stenotrophomonas rhizophila TaxID=216778 RepID=A0AAP5AH12_9GAMM|nr:MULTISPECIES: hypothetical protein [Stenotrophomonas]HDS0925276.1 hypothetical protein [Stenotrophomonas maltophilia]MDQ1107320.1 hypothetical protein [Stenotrophomonas rhizophila]MDQ1190290.1 hypothetical protein [Stenotrophomonas sp. SORGH_AS_0282]MDY0979908.1 hypothetical protein [Stenotrophomonas sp. CFBP8994]UQY87188.1 hypothetical protein LQE85_17155 [Stenotrophomonas rhizophila]
MLNSVDAGRRLMLRAAVYPLAAVAVLALVLLLLAGPKYALGALASGIAVSAGGWVAARMALGGGVQAAGSAMSRLILAVVAKWALVFGVLAVGFVVFKLPALALLAGIAVGLMFQVLALARR